MSFKITIVRAGELTIALIGMLSNAQINASFVNLHLENVIPSDTANAKNRK